MPDQYGQMLPVRILEEIAFWKKQEQEHTEVIKGVVPQLEKPYVKLLDEWAVVFEATGAATRQLMEASRERRSLPAAEDFPYREPSGLAAIRRLRPDGPRRLAVWWTPAQWRDRFYGAWLGRSAGCALGKPLEYWDYLY
ncbi:hypothetical protein AMQ83_31690, partial [Paenibacillus riograndensis]